MIFDLNTYSVIVRIILAAVLSGFIGIALGAGFYAGALTVAWSSTLRLSV